MVEVVIVGAEIWLIEDLLFTCCDSSSGVRLAAKFRLGPRKSLAFILAGFSVSARR